MKKQYNQPSLVLTTMATASFCNYSLEGDAHRVYTGETANPNADKVDQSGNDIANEIKDQVNFGLQW